MDLQLDLKVPDIFGVSATIAGGFGDPFAP
jgi:hypothetical protein